LIASGRIFGQGLDQDLFEALRKVRIQAARPSQIFFEDLVEGRQRVGAVKGPDPERGFVQHATEREHVGASIDIFGGHLLGRHVRELALDLARFRRPVLLTPSLRDAEVGEANDALRRHQHVLR
jgi:hypothetical protein